MPHYSNSHESFPIVAKKATGTCETALKAFGGAVDDIRSIDLHTDNATDKKMPVMNREARDHLRYCGYHLARVLIASGTPVIDENTQNQEEVNKNLNHAKTHAENAQLTALEFGLSFQLSVLGEFEERYNLEALDKFFVTIQRKFK